MQCNEEKSKTDVNGKKQQLAIYGGHGLFVNSREVNDMACRCDNILQIGPFYFISTHCNRINID